ncbi:peptidylprolyl isomerase [Microcoleus sp. FACHB-1515]|uniref:peptidylprolyl isomerase n=1 Tax=Cyanophyceae TaxID=3028117 RepID=UPI0016860D8E|nr:peptidylprolyl isomerase [Microcoleus sp. FACHB-1515]MBD2089717.1 peptidylprolyl isomerase [Microcoleus sp. FACHB-1515]
MQIKISRWFAALLLVGTIALTSCTGSNTGTATSDTATAPTPAATASAPSAIASLPRLNGEATVEITVKGSPIRIRVDGANAPITAGNFVDLVNRKVYDGTLFHRVVRTPQPFVVQGGDPLSKDANVPAQLLGTGSFVDPKTEQPRYVPLEIKPVGAQEPVYSQTLGQAGITQPPVLKHTRGAVAMARSQFPDSASSQFYFALADLAPLDGDYAVFGYVTEGMDVVDQIEQGDAIESAKVTSGLDRLENGGQ